VDVEHCEAVGAGSLCSRVLFYTIQMNGGSELSATAEHRNRSMTVLIFDSSNEYTNEDFPGEPMTSSLRPLIGGKTDISITEQIFAKSSYLGLTLPRGLTDTSLAVPQGTNNNLVFSEGRYHECYCT
jgi:hypothetical protein